MPMGSMKPGRLKYTQLSASEGEIAIEKLKRYKSPGTDQILTEMIEAGGESLCSNVHNLINYVRNKEELPQWW